MTFDPYAVLGVSRDATVRQIKAGYYARARSTHPDIARTTDARPFQDVVRAFGILSDPERRKRFDETGSAEEVDVAKERRAAMEVLAGLFEKLVDAAGKAGKQLKSINFIQGLRELVDGNIEDADGQRRSLRRKIDDRLDLRRRITRENDGANLFADRLTAQIDSMNEEFDQQGARLRILNLARTELGNYRNEVEMISAFQMAAYGYSSPSSGSSWTMVRTPWS